MYTVDSLSCFPQSISLAYIYVHAQVTYPSRLNHGAYHARTVIRIYSIPQQDCVAGMSGAIEVTHTGIDVQVR